MKIIASNIGYPSIGEKRELKFLIEGFWRGEKSREELELEIADVGTMSAIIGRLGLSPVFRYEKYRTEYRQSRGAGMAMLDETPVGVYLELEGEPRWIDRTARQLGFSERDYIVHSYARLYLEWRRRKRVKPGDMVFGV